MATPSDNSTEHPASLPELAKRYAQLRFRVFPLHTVSSACSCKQRACAQPGNHPRFDDWAAQATSNVVTVEKWWRRWPKANIGVVAADGKFVRVDPTQPLPPSHDGEPETLYLPSSKVFQGMQRALVSPKQWHFAPDDVPYYADEATDLVYSYGGHRGPEVNASAADAANRALQANISILDPPTSIVYIAAMAKWIAARQNGTLSSSTLSVTIHVNEILDLMARRKHKNGGYKLDQKRDISIRFQQLDSIMVSGPNPNPFEKNKRLRGRILNVTFNEDVDLLGSTTPYQFFVKPGDAVWETIVSGTVELTDFFVSLAQLDTTRGVERMAFLIGVYVVFQYRIRESSENFDQPWKISTILERARVPIEQDAKHYTRFREQVDAALDRLKCDGVFADWRYADGDEESLPVRGWFKPWLQTCIVITPPAIVRERARLRATSKRDRLAATRSGKGGRTGVME